jgi:hypothetical protein
MRHNVGASAERLIALLDGAVADERRRAERHAEWLKASPGLAAQPRFANWSPPRREVDWYSSRGTRLWSKLTKSQVALWLSAHADLRNGGDRSLSFLSNSADDLAERYKVSRRLLFMGIELRKSGNAVLIRAVAEGGVSLGDALAHIDRPAAELRKAITMVERRESRSLRQALDQ